jgi:hypothetical protein
MPNWKHLFGNDVCKCEKRGKYIISKNTKIVGFACEEHKAEAQKRK